jgi:ZIP family zinc transporter
MHSVLVMGIALGTLGATLIGGVTALRFRDRLHLVLGFSAGAVIAVAFFNLLPEALQLGAESVGTPQLIALAAAGFFSYMVLDRLIPFHTHVDAEHGAGHAGRGWLGAASLSAHSLMDGFAIGIGFQAAPAVGLVVAVAVLAHDFSDGMNTVNLVVKHGGTPRLAFAWLSVDALAPVLGAAMSLFAQLPLTVLSIMLAVFSGFFFYIGGSDLLPDSYHAHPKFLTTVMTLFGAAALYVVVRVVG